MADNCCGNCPVLDGDADPLKCTCKSEACERKLSMKPNNGDVLMTLDGGNSIPTIFVSLPELVAKLNGLGIDGLKVSYTEPLPTEPGLYVFADVKDLGSLGYAVFRLVNKIEPHWMKLVAGDVAVVSESWLAKLAAKHGGLRMLK